MDLDNAGRVLTHAQLLEDVWGPGYATQTQYLRVYMVQLRHNLEQDAARPRYLGDRAGHRLPPARRVMAR